MPPFLVAVVMFADDDAKADTGPALAAIAFMVQAIDIGLVERLSADEGGRCQEGAARQGEGGEC